MNCRARFFFCRCYLALIGFGLFAWSQHVFAQTAPPNLPTNALALPVPYEQGIASIRAQGAARPSATRPKLSGESTAPQMPAGGAPAGGASNATSQK